MLHQCQGLFNGDKTAMLSSLSDGVNDKTDERALVEMLELFSSALHINMMLISYNDSSTRKT